MAFLSMHDSSSTILPVEEKTSPYRRAPIPKSATLPIGYFILCWFLFLFSPFIGFYINGRVDENGFKYAVPYAALGLLGCVYLNFKSNRKRAEFYNSASPEFHREHKEGKLFPPLEQSASIEQLEILLDKKGKKKLKFTQTNLYFTPHTCLNGSYFQSLYYNMNKEELAKNLIDGEYIAISWENIMEWEVREEYEAPDYYYLKTNTDLPVRLKRPSKSQLETQILDCVRSIGQVPVRIFCDI